MKHLSKCIISILLVMSLCMSLVAAAYATELATEDVKITVTEVVDTAEESAQDKDTETEKKESAKEEADDEKNDAQPATDSEETDKADKATADEQAEGDKSDAEQVEQTEEAKTEAVATEPAQENATEENTARTESVIAESATVEPVTVETADTEGSVQKEETEQAEAQTVNATAETSTEKTATTTKTTTSKVTATQTATKTEVKTNPKLNKTEVTVFAGKEIKLTVSGAAGTVQWSSSNEKVATVKEGTVQTVGAGTATISAKVDGKTLKCTVKVNTNYLSLVAKASTKVYNKIASIHCRHDGGANTYAKMVKYKKITCGTAVSISLQEAGMLSKGKTITHTDDIGDSSRAVRKKSSPSKAIRNLGNLKKGSYTLVKAGVPYAKLKAKYQQAGMVYVQDSNICISAGGGKIYSANEGSVQMKHGRYYKTKVSSGYPLRSKILFVIVPKGEV